MSPVVAAILGFIQGITEFLPISSSGHLMLAQNLFGLENLDHLLPFDLICHAGTLLAIIITFRFEIKHVLTKDQAMLKKLCIATLPLFPAVIIYKPLKALYASPQSLGFFFLATALLLFMTMKFAKEQKASLLNKRQNKDSVIIGLFQTLALIPGISRSGTTIASARLLGWNANESFSFAFLLAIPAILGGMCVEGWKSANAFFVHVSLTNYLLGFATAFVSGLFALHLLKKLVFENRFTIFVWYLTALGLISLWLF